MKKVTAGELVSGRSVISSEGAAMKVEVLNLTARGKAMLTSHVHSLPPTSTKPADPKKQVEFQETMSHR